MITDTVNCQLSTVNAVPFIDKASDTMHVDLNSCFASIEQQCNALLRGRPVAVAAYTTPRGCILSPSVEAKRFGVKTGMRVMDGKQLCPDLVVLPVDPWKYRWVNQKMNLLFQSYTPQFRMKSIDEAVLSFAGCQLLVDGDPIASLQDDKSDNCQPSTVNSDLSEIALDIKRRIKSDIGEWLTVSIGIGPNQWLAKTAAGLHKPDGLDELQWWNIEPVLTGMKLEDLNGINVGNAGRLRRNGILTPIQLYHTDIPTLRRAFKSILGWQWHMKMRGYEVDDRPVVRKSYSHMYSLPKPASTPEELADTMSKMVHSLGFRLRRGGFQCRGLFLGLVYQDWFGWYHHWLLPRPVYDSADLFAAMVKQIEEHVADEVAHGIAFRPVHKVYTGCFALEKLDRIQTTWFYDEAKKRRLVQAVDRVHAEYGKLALFPARMLGVHRKGWVKEFVPFGGGVRELEEWVLEDDTTVEAVPTEFTE